MIGGVARALRCSTCSINFPVTLAHQLCDVCGGKTQSMFHAVPDEDWEENVERLKNPAARPIGSQRGDGRANRVWNYLRMGFNEFQADKLADAVFNYGRAEPVPLHWATVEDALQTGHDPLVVFDAFA